MGVHMERAILGAKLMDENRPGWFDGIDKGTLNMRFGNVCVLAQCYRGYSEGHDALGLKYGTVIENGFDSEGFFRRFAYWRLKVNWLHLIEERQRAARLAAA